MTYSDQVPAIVYLRTDLCGPVWTEQRTLRLGYELCETIRVDAGRSSRLVFLEDRIRLHEAEAVFVPTVEHLDGQLGRIVAQADVIEQNGRTHARWSPIAGLLDESLLDRIAQFRVRREPGPLGDNAQ
ncbi:hypothetical protein [Nocardia brevicatena]|uniref:hypothetical protein n=1 Tax=Nocardia brevicatena TaxID=37327 RepID=UPI0012FB9D99|nr:hypothetical protein [Nocardia brevicatena]